MTDMRRFCQILPMLLLLPALLSAQTPVGGTVNGVWKKANSPYIMVANVVVPNGMSLTIEAGVEVRAFGNTQLATSGGTISVNGTATEPVRFSATDTSLLWHGLYLHSGGTLIADYISLADADTAIRIKGNASSNTTLLHGLLNNNLVGIAAQQNFVLNSSVLRDNAVAGLVLDGSFSFTANGNQFCNFPTNVQNNTDSTVFLGNNCWCTADTALIAASLVRTSVGGFDYFPIDSGCLPSLVFVGDTDHSGAVSTADLLPIGLRFGETGPVRGTLPPTTVPWVGLPSTAWADTLQNGVNLQNVDCNGDGVINDADADVLMLRYDNQWTQTAAVPATGAGLLFDFQAGQTFTAGDTVLIPIEVQPVNNLYGMSFSVQLDTAMLGKSSQGFSPIMVQYYGNWFGTVGTDVLARSKALPAKGRVDIGMVRKDKTPRTGGGKVADIIVVLDDHIAKQNIIHNFQMAFSDVVAVDVAGNTLPLGGTPYTMTVQTTANDGSVEQHIRLYPNPATNTAYVVATGGNIHAVELLNMVGATVREYAFAGADAMCTLSLDAVPAGLYVARITTAQGVVHQPLTIQRN